MVYFKKINDFLLLGSLLYSIHIIYIYMHIQDVFFHTNFFMNDLTFVSVIENLLYILRIQNFYEYLYSGHFTNLQMYNKINYIRRFTDLQNLYIDVSHFCDFQKPASQNRSFRRRKMLRKYQFA